MTFKEETRADAEVSKFEKIRLVLLEGGKTTPEIAHVVGCSREYVCVVSRKIGVGPARGARGQAPSNPEPSRRRRPRRVIRADLARQLEDIVRKFEASL